MCQLQHSLCEFLCIKCFRKKSCFLVVDDQIHGSCMKCNYRKSELECFHDNHRPSLPSGWKKEDRRIQVIFLWLIGITYEVYTVINVASFGIRYDLVPKISGSNDIQLPFIILFAEFLEGFHHKIQTLRIYETGGHEKSLGFRIAFTFTDETSRIDLNFCVNIQKLLIISLIIITEYNVSVQFRKIFLQQAFLFPEYNIGNFQISCITVMLPADGLCL